jgi:hypothetical protein
MIPSHVWILVIVAGALLFAVANIFYPLARDSENKASKATQVRQLLQGELQRNQAILGQMEQTIATGTLPLRTFETTAWQTVSASDLLLGLPNEELATLLQSYELMNRANSLHAKALDTMVGVASALSGSETVRATYLNELSAVLTQLKTLMGPLIKKDAAVGLVSRAT